MIDNPSSRSPTRILVVDDSESLRSVIQELLQSSLRVSVDTARSGFEAADRLSKMSYSAVVSDMEMPDGDGRWLLSYMKENGCESPLIIFSAQPRSDIPALDSCLKAVVEKGDFESLIQALKSASPE